MLLLFLCCNLSGESCHAVIINVGDGSGNTTAPGDDFGFSNVGMRGVGSAVYLGNRWVLTASHVGPGSVFLNGVEFENVVEETHRLTNPVDGISTTTDLILIRLQDEPGLPSLRLGCEAVSIGSEVIMVGAGRNREVEPSYWSVDVIKGEGNDVWTRTTADDATKDGFQTTDTRSLRWGTNLVNVIDIEANSGSGDVLSFATTFDEIVPVSELAQGVRGDSGGAVFQKNGGVWELVGLMHAISLADNQPGGINTAIFGNETFIADLKAYEETIRAIADFEPAAGDINGDGKYTAMDIDRMLEALVEPDYDSCHFDLTGNSTVETADFDVLLNKAGTVVGDTNLNGEVDFSDFLRLAWSFGDVGAGWAGGDFDGDGETTFTDFLTLANTFGDKFQTSPMAQTAAVPEPSSLLLFATGFLLLAARRLRR